MNANIQVDQRDHVAWVTLSHPGKFNAMSRAMWRALRLVFEGLQRSTDVHCVVVSGDGGHFCAGGDISEYPGFRFSEDSLREFHEGDVWGGLRAMLDCDVPLVAQISGNCMGAGLEIASCCDIRIAGESAKFGAPIARLGFPMAPREAQLVMGAVGALTAREMLLEAAIFGAHDMKARGFLNRVVGDAQAESQAHAAAARIAALAPQAARLNKQTLRDLSGLAAPEKSVPGPVGLATQSAAYAYADSPEHREGIQAFLEKRKTAF